MTSKNTRSVKPQQALEEYLSALLMPDSEEESVGQVAPVPSVQAAPVEAPAVAEPVLDAQQKESLQRALLTPLQRQARSSMWLRPLQLSLWSRCLSERMRRQPPRELLQRLSMRAPII